jgi:hypothetical protein
MVVIVANARITVRIVMSVFGAFATNSSDLYETLAADALAVKGELVQSTNWILFYAASALLGINFVIEAF